VEDVLVLIILGTVLGIGAVALMAWGGATLMHRVLGFLGQDSAGTPEETGESMPEPPAGGKHRPGRSGEDHAA
jgi:hypothetical protein